MDQPYSPFADWLSKFHTSSQLIQALRIIAIAVIAVSFAWSLTAPFRLWFVRRERADGIPDQASPVREKGETQE